MKEHVQKRWADALRSGTYTKCRGRLAMWSPYTGQSAYCALGVLVDLARLDGVSIVYDMDSPNDDDGLEEVSRLGFGVPNDDTDWYEVRLNQMESSLPDEVLDWAGLTDGSPTLFFSTNDNIVLFNKYSVGNDEESITFLNDEADIDFTTLGDLIENGTVY